MPIMNDTRTNADHTMNSEARRCLLCKKARCAEACPVHTDVPAAMQLYREGKIAEAARMIFDNNPFSAITAQVCNWKQFCMGHCVLNLRDEPVRWYEIEQELSMAWLPEAHPEAPAGDTGRKVAIAGAGPAGITAALRLRRLGHAVDLFDAFPRAGGVLRYGIPDFRLEKRYVDAYERILAEAGIRFIGNTVIGKDRTLADLRKEYDAVLLAAGAWIVRTLDIPGEDSPKVIPALDFLKDPDRYELGRKVLVVGGGNVAMDACRTALRKGCDTTDIYRKTFENMPANPDEVRAAQEEGVKFEIFTVPVAIRTEADGRTVAVVRRCENYTREDGSLATRILEGTDRELPFDSMIVSIGQSADKRIYAGEDPAQMPDVFTAGDFALGPRTVVEAVRDAKDAADRIAAFLV